MPDIFLLVLSEKSQEIEQKIKTFYPKRYHQFSDTIFLISADTTTRKVAVNVGVRDDEFPHEGAVFKLEGSYSGFADPGLWEWLKKESSSGIE